MFKPKGKEALWKAVYNYIKDKPVGTLVGFTVLSQLIEQDAEKIRTPIYKANKKLIENHKRMLISEHGEGYKIVEGNEQLRHAEFRHGKANIQIKTAQFEAVNLNTTSMTLDEKARWQNFLTWNSNALYILSQNISQISKVQKVTSLSADIIGQQLENMQENLSKYAKQFEDLKKKIG